MPPPTPEATHPFRTNLPLNIPCAHLSSSSYCFSSGCFPFQPLLALVLAPSAPSPGLIALSPAYVRRLRNLSCTWPPALDTACNIYDNRLHRNFDSAADTAQPIRPGGKRRRVTGNRPTLAWPQADSPSSLAIQERTAHGCCVHVAQMLDR